MISEGTLVMSSNPPGAKLFVDGVERGVTPVGEPFRLVFQLMTFQGVRFVLAHARRLRAIAEANYKRDDIDAELLARQLELRAVTGDCDHILPTHRSVGDNDFFSLGHLKPQP